MNMHHGKDCGSEEWIDMACKNLTEALLEDVIEITWMFDGLVKSGKIKSWDEICEQEYGSDGIKATIKNIAQKFEEKYPFETTWEDSDLDYIEEIEKFAKEELIREYGKVEDEPDMIDGVTTCCDMILRPMQARQNFVRFVVRS